MYIQLSASYVVMYCTSTSTSTVCTYIYITVLLNYLSVRTTQYVPMYKYIHTCTYFVLVQYSVSQRFYLS